MRLLSFVLLATTLCAVSARPVQMDVFMRALANMYMEEMEASTPTEAPVESQGGVTETPAPTEEEAEAEAEEEQEVEPTEPAEVEPTERPTVMDTWMRWLEFDSAATTVATDPEAEEEESEQEPTERPPQKHNLMQWFEFELFLQKVPQLLLNSPSFTMLSATEAFNAMCQEMLGWLENGYLRQWLINHHVNKRDRRMNRFMDALMGTQTAQAEQEEPRGMEFWVSLVKSCSAYQDQGRSGESTQA